MVGKRWAQPSKPWIALCFVAGPAAALVSFTVGLHIDLFMGIIVGLVPPLVCYAKWPESGKKMPKILFIGPGLGFLTSMIVFSIWGYRVIASL
ncbi:MAG: hypothetical protein MPK62_00020 [Alphaproteobacteria bacterium]|nr:hypothetical protein [Alphaproteobacteria bacterium]MDA8029522.1 hypothetical protein [Alphaproteobacteria bacterium]